MKWKNKLHGEYKRFPEITVQLSVTSNRQKTFKPAKPVTKA